MHAGEMTQFRKTSFKKIAVETERILDVFPPFIFDLNYLRQDDAVVCMLCSFVVTMLFRHPNKYFLYLYLMFTKC